MLASERTISDAVLADLLHEATRRGASDIHLAEGSPPWYRTHGLLEPAADGGPFAAPLTAGRMDEILDVLLDEGERLRLESRGSADGAFSCGDARFRFSAFRSGGRWCLAIRMLDNRFRPLGELGLDEGLYRVCESRDGLVLVAGPTGSGKSTTLATLVDRVNETRACHIITIEDPIEYLHANRRALVSQRHVGVDTPDFPQALVDAVRQDPDVILVGELRDLATIRTAVLAAETGHLVLASVHAGDCIGAIDRMISVFPAGEQQMIRQLLATTLRTIIAQHLLVAAGPAGTAGPDPRPARNRVLASEVMHVVPAVANLIAGNNLVQIRTVMETHRREGMYTLDHSLDNLLRRGLITRLQAMSLARNPAMIGGRSGAIAAGPN